MKKAAYWERKCREERRVASLSHTTLTKQRGFKGSKMGPANDGRRLSDEEKAKVVAEMKQQGRL